MSNHRRVNIPSQVGQGRKEAHLISGLTIGHFIEGFNSVGMGDVVFVEKTDHDAGHKPANENWFWDSTGYDKYFLWTRAISVNAVCQLSDGKCQKEMCPIRTQKMG